ncbi:MAG: selenocysteine-specific translation elongation factor, partial [Jatrophihabitantaceae bacterium]
MRVVATAGHVDHGKSTLVRMLTGMEPDRWAEERRRGMTIDLGFGWTTLASGEPVAFVDVPGHQRFVPNMLAGIGSVPAVLLVIAADQGWRRQTSEHLDAINALQIRHGLLAITRSDLAEPGQVAAVIEDATSRLAGSSLGAVEAIAVSGLTGQGIAELRDGLGRLVASMPDPRRDGRVRLWIDRAFTVKGAGTVLTGTLGDGRLAVGDELELTAGRYSIRGLQALGNQLPEVSAVARVAVNLRGLDRDRVGRGDCLLSPGQWWHTDRLDVRLDPLLAEPTPELVLHVGTAAIPVRLRMFDDRHGRLTLARPVPAQVGDRAILRDPAQQAIVAGVLVLDPDPPALTRRGAAADRAAGLADGTATSLRSQVRRRGAIRRQALLALGIAVPDSAVPDSAVPDSAGRDSVELDSAGVLERAGWLIDPIAWQRWQDALARAVDEQAAADPRQPGLAADAARRRIGLPDQALLRPLAGESGLDWSEGRLGRPGVRPSLGHADRAVRRLLDRLDRDPFDAPERAELA